MPSSEVNPFIIHTTPRLFPQTKPPTQLPTSYSGHFFNPITITNHGPPHHDHHHSNPPHIPLHIHPAPRQQLTRRPELPNQHAHAQRPLSAPRDRETVYHLHDRDCRSGSWESLCGWVPMFFFFPFSPFPFPPFHFPPTHYVSFTHPTPRTLSPDPLSWLFSMCEGKKRMCEGGGERERERERATNK